MILYLQSHRRRPVRLAPLMPWEDAQGAVPVGWCVSCGGEIYEGGAYYRAGGGTICPACFDGSDELIFVRMTGGEGLW